MSERPLRRAVPLLAALLLAGSIRAAEITGAAWHGPDLTLTLSDSAGYSVDLVESDSSQLVILFPGTAKHAGLATDVIDGPQGRHAAITQESAGLRLTVAGEGRLGYSTEWRPYTHRLIVHTFDWATLPYPEQQFHKGLLALEEHLDDRARELLDVAYATGDRRAGTLLGIRYARQGKDSLALRYLHDPADADEYLALADVDRRHGDMAAARADEAHAQEMLAREAPPTAEAPPMYPRPRLDRGMESRSERMARRYSGWRWVVVGAGAAILLLGFAVWLLSRTIGRRAAQQAAAGTPAGSAPPTPERKTTTVATPSSAAPHSAASAPAAAPPAATPATEMPVVVPVVESPVVAAPVTKVETVTPVSPVEPAAPEPPVVPPAAPAEVQQKPAAPPAPVISPVAESSAPEREEPAPAPEQKAPAPAETSEPPHELERTIPAQAAEVRQKIQAQRKDMPAPAESTVAAARRLHISRDNVELRRKMAETAKKKDR